MQKRSIIRLIQLAGLSEAAQQIDDPDEEDRRYDEQRERERRIVAAILFAFKKIGLPIAERDDAFGGPDIYYDESDREATVVLDTDGVDLDLLIKLKQTGLSAKFEVHGANDGLEIKFIVAPELDDRV